MALRRRSVSASFIKNGNDALMLHFSVNGGNSLPCSCASIAANGKRTEMTKTFNQGADAPNGGQSE